MRLHRRLLFAATLLAFAVIALGAYVRLSDAGLGCPDWPGCYGHWLGVPEKAAGAFPDRPIDTSRAWKEMTHRYFAGSLGLLILALGISSWRGAIRRQHSPLLPSLLVGIVGLQAALGMWTVTLRLKPVIVTLHLLGGMSTLAVLLALTSFLGTRAPLPEPGRAVRRLARLALLAIVIQIALGGWVSSNYAALACSDLPLCQGEWMPSMDLAHAFTLQRELGQTADGQLLPFGALAAIHWCHRLGALAVLLTTGALAAGLLRTKDRRSRRWGGALFAMLTLQLTLGIGNVLLSLPLPIAVAHTLGAAGLLAIALSINLRLLSADQAKAGRTISAQSPHNTSACH